MPEYQFIPIVMLTTVAEEEKKRQGKAAGASGWIVRPFTPEQLLNVVKKFIIMIKVELKHSLAY